MNRVPRPDRESADIIYDLLALADREPQMKTWLMYRANMNSKQIRDYIDIILRSNLMIRIADHYHTTDKGRKFLVTYGRLKELMR